jgi:hypothetical protein
VPAATTQQKQSAPNRLPTINNDGAGKKTKILAASATIWLLFWLLLIDAGVGWIKPLKFVQLPAIVFEDQDPLEVKVPRMESADSPYNVLLLGSSLTAAIATADRIHEANIGAIPGWKLHTDANALDTLMRDRLHVPIQTINMGIDACMIAEDKLLLQKALAAGKHPKMLLLLVAPRDFVSNSHSPLKHVYKYFENRVPLWNRLSFIKSPIASCELVAQNSNVYRNRGHFKQVLELGTCGLLHRAPNLFFAQKGDSYWINFSGPKLLLGCSPKGNTFNKQEATEKLNDYYRREYIPLNYKRFEKEMSALDETLKLAASNNIVAFVVNMPRGQMNEDLLPASFKQQYQERLASESQLNSAHYFNFEQDPRFTAEDFIDGVHLTSQGAMKFLNLLVQSIEGNDSARKRIKQLSW